MYGRPDIGNGHDQAMPIIVRNGAKAVTAGNCNAAAGIVAIHPGASTAMIIAGTVTINVTTAIAAMAMTVTTTAAGVKRVS